MSGKHCFLRMGSEQLTNLLLEYTKKYPIGKKKTSTNIFQ
jgi:hypothetical protein